MFSYARTYAILAPCSARSPPRGAQKSPVFLWILQYGSSLSRRFLQLLEMVVIFCCHFQTSSGFIEQVDKPFLVAGNAAAGPAPASARAYQAGLRGRGYASNMQCSFMTTLLWPPRSPQYITPLYPGPTAAAAAPCAAPQCTPNLMTIITNTHKFQRTHQSKFSRKSCQKAAVKLSHKTAQIHPIPVTPPQNSRLISRTWCKRVFPCWRRPHRRFEELAVESKEEHCDDPPRDSCTTMMRQSVHATHRQLDRKDLKGRVVSLCS